MSWPPSASLLGGRIETQGACSRRDFLHRAAVAGLGSLALARLAPTAAGAAAATAEAESDPPNPALPRSLRFVFATDFHVLPNNALRSQDGVRACLAAIEALQPQPAFILCGGDLIHELPQLDLDAAERELAGFLAFWKDHTALPTHFALGNHDLAGTRNRTADRVDPRFGKGLFRQHLGVGEARQDFYRFEAGGWRFVVLDDVLPQPDGDYLGEFGEDQLGFLRAEFNAPSPAPPPPTIVCGHIPAVSALPLAFALGKAATGGGHFEVSHKYVATNGRALMETLAGGNVRAVLAGHLHHQEQIDLDGVRFINAGAVCANWWKGPLYGCPEGFLVVDLQPDGRLESRYQAFGWKAVAT